MLLCVVVCIRVHECCCVLFGVLGCMDVSVSVRVIVSVSMTVSISMNANVNVTMRGECL